MATVSLELIPAWSQEPQSTDVVGLLKAEALPDPIVSKAKLDRGIRGMQVFLNPSQNSNGNRWMDFLRLNELQQQLAAEQADIPSLEQLERNMRQNYAGLEQPPFTELRASLGEYIRSVRFGSDKQKSIEFLQQQLEQLANKLQQPKSGASGELERNIGRVVGYLNDSNQASQYVQSIRSQYSYPNIRVLASRRFLENKMARPVSEENPVHEIILGTDITGESIVVGKVTPRLIPNSHRAVLHLEMEAQFCSDNRGLNRGVTIFTIGSAPVRVTETICLMSHGLATGGDTVADATLSTEVTGIAHRSKLVRKIASKKVVQQKPLANAIGEQRLETRLTNQFHAKLDSQLSEANSKIGPSGTPFYGRLGLSRPARTSWTTADYLAILWKQQDSRQISAPSVCKMLVDHQGASLQLHQSAILNFIDPVIGGRIIHNTELDDFARQFTKEVPESILKESMEEPWSITLAAIHPVEVEFDDELITFRIRTSGSKKGGQELDQSATVEAVYKFRIEDNSIQLDRVGDVKIEFLGRQQLGTRATVLRSFLKSKFESVFKEQLLEKPVRPLDQLPDNIPPLTLTSIHCDDGWLQASVE